MTYKDEDREHMKERLLNASMPQEDPILKPKRIPDHLIRFEAALGLPLKKYHLNICTTVTHCLQKSIYREQSCLNLLDQIITRSYESSSSPFVKPLIILLSLFHFLMPLILNQGLDSPVWVTGYWLSAVAINYLFSINLYLVYAVTVLHDDKRR